jgi:hypothetical protein
MNSDNIMSFVIHALVLYRSEEHVPLSVKDIRFGTWRRRVGHRYCLPVWCQETDTPVFYKLKYLPDVWQGVSSHNNWKGSLFLSFSSPSRREVKVLRCQRLILCLFFSPLYVRSGLLYKGSLWCTLGRAGAIGAIEFP